MHTFSWNKNEKKFVDVDTNEKGYLVALVKAGGAVREVGCFAATFALKGTHRNMTICDARTHL
jgi:hypothetical protein